MADWTIPVDDGLCAVVDCPERGAPQVCVYDGRYHHHGYIHYREGDASGLSFRGGAWHGLCDPHYAELVAKVPALAGRP